MKIIPLSYNKLSKKLIKFGFNPIRQKGSHVFYRHQDGRTTVVPHHPGEEIGKGLIRKIMRDIDITAEEFYEK